MKLLLSSKPANVRDFDFRKAETPVVEEKINDVILKLLYFVVLLNLLMQSNRVTDHPRLKT